MSKTFSLITGASSGIGKATAYKFAENARNLILIARRFEELEKMKGELEAKYKIEVLIYQVDVQNLKEIEDFFEKIKDKEIDILVNNAGLARGKDSLENYNWDDIEDMINTNIKAFLRVAKLTIPYLKKTEGHIVNISSIAGIEAYEGGSVYCASKAFVKMISKGLRIDLLGTNIRVTDIAPGAVETEFSEVRFHGDKEKASSVYKGYQALKAEDIAETINFAVNQPKHVNLEYMLIMPTAQASATRVFKNL